MRTAWWCFLLVLGRASVYCCKDEMDCGANGACTGGVCHCTAPWVGPQCSNLALLPVDRGSSGYRPPSSSSWGGSILRGDGDGGDGGDGDGDGNSTTTTRHWMWASEMVGNCGLKAWTRNSRVVLAASAAGPAGPYAFVKELWPVFSHEPVAARAPTGEYVVWFTSDAYGTAVGEAGGGAPCVPPCFDGGSAAGVHPGGRVCLGGCANGSSFVPGDGGHPACADNRTIERSPLTRLPTVMSWAPHPLGPWSAPVVVYNGSDGSAGGAASGDTNFAGVILHDSSVLGLWRGVGAPGSAPPATAANPRGAARMQYGARARHWRDARSYAFGRAEAGRNVFPALADGGGANCGGGIEDPTVWLDARGRLHALVHNYAAGGHAASDDGGATWRWYGGTCSNGTADEPPGGPGAALPGAHDDAPAPRWCAGANCSAWGAPVRFTGGDPPVELQQRERPHVVLGGADGRTVVALSTGVREPDGQHDRTWTMVQSCDLR